MNNKLIFTVIAILFFTISSFFIFTGYGGNNCDQPPENTCNCFCCDMFNSRGYESCGIFGLVLGISIALFASYIIHRKR